MIEVRAKSDVRYGFDAVAPVRNIAGAQDDPRGSITGWWTRYRFLNGR